MKKIAMWLVYIGALLWGILGVTGLFGAPYNLLASIFGGGVFLNVVYALVGVAGLYLIFGKGK